MEKMIYAIVDSGKNQDGISEAMNCVSIAMGLPGYLVSYKDISAVLGILKEKTSNVSQTDALEYAHVIEKLALYFSLLPMRYGAIVKTDDDVRELLEKNYEALRQNLQKVENKDEFSLKVFWDYLKSGKKIKKEAEYADSNIPEAMQGNSVHKVYLMSKLKEHRFETMLLQHAEQIMGEIGRQIAKLTPFFNLKKMSSQSLIIDTVLLLEKSRQHELIQLTTEIQNQYPELKLILTGPWPPYSFVQITLE